MNTIHAYITNENADFYSQADFLGTAPTMEEAIRFAETYDTGTLPILPEGQIYDICIKTA